MRRRQIGALVLVLIATAVGVESSARQAASRPKLTDSLVAYYKLDSASGADAHGTNTLTASASAPTSVAGKIATAAQFTATSSQYFYAADSPALSTGNIPFTVCLWVYLDNVNGADPMQLFGKWDTGINQREFYMQYAPNQGGAGVGRYKFSVSPDGTITGVDSAVSNTFGEPLVSTWHLVCGWHTPGVGVSIQVDCGGIDFSAHTTGVFDSSTLLTMGTYNGATVPTDFMDGRIDSVGFWKRLFGQDECQLLRNLGVGKEYPW